MTRTDVTSAAAGSRLLLAALLSVAVAAVADVSSSATAPSGGPLLLWLLLLWGVGRGSHAAWVLACALSTSGAVLVGYVALADLLPTTTFQAVPQAEVVALLHLVVTALLTSPAVRVHVGRGPRERRTA